MARDNAPSAVVVQQVSELRIVDDEVWRAVRERQARMDVPLVENGEATPAPFWTKQRPRFLFSGLMRSGACGGGYSKMSAAHFGCSVARNQGETRCTNCPTIRQDRVETTVLDALRARLMDPELFGVFCEAFTAEWNRLAAEQAGSLAQRRRELERVQRQLDKLIDALADGAPRATVRDRMVTLEARRELLGREIREACEPPPRLHPNLALGSGNAQSPSLLAGALASQIRVDAGTRSGRTLHISLSI